MLKRLKPLLNLLLCILALHLTGCATATVDNPDPYEHFNRKVFAFNQVADKFVLKPVAVTYRFVTPKFARQGVDNFFNNAGDTTVIVNDLLQFKLKKTGADVTRMAINSTIGLAGFIDVASSWGYQRVPLTFGDTLSVYGWENSAYIIVPILGPWTVRDMIGSVPDCYFSAWCYIKPEYLQASLAVLDIVNKRAIFLEMERLLRVASFDDYVLFRDIYFQRRAARLSGEGGGDGLAF